MVVLEIAGVDWDDVHAAMLLTGTVSETLEAGGRLSFVVCHLHRYRFPCWVSRGCNRTGKVSTKAAASGDALGDGRPKTGVPLSQP